MRDPVTALREAGIRVPAAEREALRAAADALATDLALLAEAEAEPAHIFRPDPLGGG